MSADEGALKRLVLQFVNIYSADADTGLDLFLNPPPAFMPLNSDSAKQEAAKHFLLAAALSDSELTGNARNIRILLNHLHSAFGEKLYTTLSPGEFEREVANCEMELKNLD